MEDGSIMQEQTFGDMGRCAMEVEPAGNRLDTTPYAAQNQVMSRRAIVATYF